MPETLSGKPLGRREFLNGLLVLGVTACSNMRINTAETLNSTKPPDLPNTTVGTRDLSHEKESVVLQTVYDEPEIYEKERVIIDDESVSEGLKAMAELAPGHSFIGKFDGNGGRDSLIYTPTDFNPGEPAEIMYFFHGTGCHIILPPKDENFEIGQITSGKKDEPCVGTRALNQVLGAIERAYKVDKNIILVYPLSDGPRNHNKYDMRWMHGEKESFQTLHSEVLNRIQEDMKIETDISRISVKGHSAGGVPLGHIMRSLKRYDTAIPDEIVFLDASYWNLGKAHSRAIAANPNMKIELFIHNSKYTGSAAKIISGRRGVELFDTNGTDDTGERITHSKLMRNYLLGKNKKAQFAEM